MSDYLDQLQNAIASVRVHMPLALLLVGLLWTVLIINKLVDYRLNILGIYPRNPLGLLGIIFHPLLHGGFNHLFFNSIPLFVLLTFMLTTSMATFVCVSLVIILLSGLGIWLFGRKAIHIGASGLIMGYWGYLLVFAYRNPSVLSYILAIICIYYFGSLLISIFPSEEKTSWEGHLFGLGSGIAATYICPLLSAVK